MNYKPLFETVLSDGAQFSNRCIFQNGAQAFSCKSEERMEKLWWIFGDGGVVNDNFVSAFNQCATRFEKDRIHQLNSSSLLPLLCFWNIAKNNSIWIEGKTYTRVDFEFKNKVFTPRSPSSVDILLINSEKKELLFLESKFTEPLNPKPYLDIRSPYKSIYEKLKGLLGVELSNIRNNYNTGDKALFTIFSKENQYWDGIKQMISHLIGVLQGPNSLKGFDYIKDGYKVRLGTILYDFSSCGVDEYEEPYKNYEKLYKRVFSPDNLEQIIESLKSDDRLKVRLNVDNLEVFYKPLTYQKVFDNTNNAGISTPMVRLFYKF